MLALIGWAIIVLAALNVARLALYLLGSQLYAGAPQSRKPYNPTVSLVVPAHNEGVVIERTLAGLLAVTYSPLQIVVVDDGSTDDTAERIFRFKSDHDPDGRIETFTQLNGGKADALNNAIRSRATGELVMCLDGDSVLAPDAVARSVEYFRDERVVATASNVNIIPDGTVLGFIQRFEYLVNHYMKRAQTAFNLEYIIGGIGSMFRRSTLDEVGLYDTNTVTEDIDLTMKIIARKGNKDSRVVFAADSMVYTEAVPSLKSLIGQRTRWKFGRTQAFFKHWRLFFSTDRKHSLSLSWFALPMVLFQELAGLLEPVMITALLVIVVIFHSPATLLQAVALLAVFSSLNILGNTHLSKRERLMFVAASPLMYLGFYLITVVEYVALLKTVVRAPRLRRSVSVEKVTWVSPERSGVVTA